ncbi:hypothetical protein LOK49_LG01G03378 [Camellia lanceoleosa]|uniref:Uncharacterized protein n=1 Tax=Camellia lanceoleosa TaxID=1840588 RepID=A0ACC0IXG4_9ERIC|nr:hypothetical protein LOK49_LG01G03378 [Camellia lanceoleosa]
MQEEVEKKEGHFVLVHEIAVIPEIGRSQGYRFGLHFLCLSLKVARQVPHSWILYGVDGVHGVSPSDDKMILVGLSIVISHLLLWSGSLPQRSAVVCHCSYAGF